MAQAPNTYPTWFAPKARVSLGFSPRFLTNFPAHFIEVGPPAARLKYRVIEPADYHLKVATSNWTERGEQQFDFDFFADFPAPMNRWSASPKGTVLLLHGWGVAQFAMAPWALRLAQDGWRCVLLDLRGHGKSTGKRIYFGLQETNDLSRLLDQLQSHHQLTAPVAVVGESYGAALALRWKTADSRIGPVVALAPYSSLSNAVLNISQDYAAWSPEFLLKAGLRKLPELLHVEASELNTSTILKRHPVPALFVAGAADRIMPQGEVRELYELSPSESQFLMIPQATHESLTYFFDALTEPVLKWLNATEGKPTDLNAVK